MLILSLCSIFRYFGTGSFCGQTLGPLPLGLAQPVIIRQQSLGQDGFAPLGHLLCHIGHRSGTGKWFHGKRIANPNTHGTGCTLSSAIASNLAKGFDLDTSVERAKAYISGCLSAMLDLGHGSGPMDHMFALKGEFVDG